MLKKAFACLIFSFPAIAMKNDKQLSETVPSKLQIKLGSEAHSSLSEQAIFNSKDTIKPGSIALIKQYPGHLRKIAQAQSGKMLNEPFININTYDDTKLPLMYVLVKNICNQNNGIIIYTAVFGRGKKGDGQRLELNQWINHEDLGIIPQDFIQEIDE